jgi:hypothetical protein
MNSKFGEVPERLADHVIRTIFHFIFGTILGLLPGIAAIALAADEFTKPHRIAIIIIDAFGTLFSILGLFTRGRSSNPRPFRVGLALHDHLDRVTPSLG